jgi:SAM-dependent methyltransferase
MESASRYSGWILERLRSHLGAAALEVGFGHSGFRALLPQGVRYAGLDLDEDVVRQARAAAPHDLFVRGDICDGRLGEQLAGFRPDSILCINVLEHVSDDRQAVRVLLSILPDHGCLLILVPALPWLYNRLDRLAGHHRRYSRAGLAALIAAGGGRIARLDYFNPLGVITWPLAGLWPRTSLADPGIQSQVRFFDRYLVPPSRLLDPWCRRIVGQSLIAVVQPPRPPSGSC